MNQFTIKKIQLLYSIINAVVNFVLKGLFFKKVEKKISFVTPDDIQKMVVDQGSDNMVVLSEIEKYIEKQVSIEQFLDRQQSTESNAQVYKKIYIYLSQFLAKEHSQLGRRGPVCPFVPGCLKMNSVYLSIVEQGDLDKKKIKKIVNKYFNQFGQIQPTDQKTRLYKAIVIIFPNIDLSQAHILIDGVQKELKADFIKKGMMIGEFHMLNNSSGLRNPHFYPLRTPYPCIAMRYMVATDIAFMNPQDCNESLRIEFLKGYIENFKDNSHWDSQVQIAQQQLNQLNEKYTK